jgi:hypothetical protein
MPKPGTVTAAVVMPTVAADMTPGTVVSAAKVETRKSKAAKARARAAWRLHRAKIAEQEAQNDAK